MLDPAATFLNEVAMFIARIVGFPDGSQSDI